MAKRNVLDWMRRPVIVAPMTREPSPDLVIAAARPGAAGFLAASGGRLP
jgi:NAD(P)H-dependent flavin oxidoreductase YrpB (nitropropane dioxygenase family)